MQSSSHTHFRWVHANTFSLAATENIFVIKKGVNNVFSDQFWDLEASADLQTAAWCLKSTATSV